MALRALSMQASAAPQESLRRRYSKRAAALKTERASWVTHWRELADFISPRRFRTDESDRNKGGKRNDLIINNTATRAVRTLSSGMMAGITSPSRPWFRLGTVDPAQSEVGEVRSWLHVVEERIRQAFARSNFYNALPLVYGDLGTFGTSAAIIDEDDKDLLRTYVLPVGQYSLTSDDRLAVNGLFRETQLTVAQLVKKFTLAKCSEHVQEMYRADKLDQWVKVCHVIGPNDSRDTDRADYRGMKWESCWFEESNTDENQMLRVSGYLDMPLVAPRWNITGEDIYGHGPGMDALGDIKALQILEKKKLKMVDKIVDPPMKGPPELMNRTISLLPGGFTAVSAGNGMQSLEPAIVIPPQAVSVARESIQDHERRIDATFMVDLWMMMSDTDRRQITAREVDERHEEKMLQLGPVLERLQDELLEPAIDRVFGILLRRGMLPRPPESLSGTDLRVEYISMAAQAQKLLSTTGIERLVSFVGNMAAASPTVMDKLNVDEVVDEYANAVGTKPDLVRPDDEVAAIRQQRAQQAQAAQAQQSLQTVSQGAKTLSQADTSGDNALTRLLGSLGGAPGASA